jgi:hypothetical protein
MVVGPLPLPWVLPLLVAAGGWRGGRGPGSLPARAMLDGQGRGTDAGAGQGGCCGLEGQRITCRGACTRCNDGGP